MTLTPKPNLVTGSRPSDKTLSSQAETKLRLTKDDPSLYGRKRVGRP